MTDADLAVIEAMEEYGGSFVKNLAKAARVADQQNLIKIAITWPDEWARYAAMATEHDRPLDLSDDDRRHQRANARNHLAEAHDKLQRAAQGLIGTEAEVLELLSIDAQPAGQADAFSEMFVAIERAYDAAEEPINVDAAAQQKREQS